jgi:DHA3 family macrolide efflux protein-like MFS transporter
MSTASDRLPRQAIALILGRGISMIGTTLTTFGLNVWVFKQTGAYDTFAYLAVLAGLPSLLFAPFAGVVADRLNKKSLLIACEVVSLLAVAGALLMHAFSHLSVFAVAATMLILALGAELRWAVLGPTIALLVPKDKLIRINGLQQAFRGINVMMGPLMGAVGVQLLGLKWLLVLDIATYVAAVGAMAAIRIPSGGRQSAEGPVFASFWDELTYGFRWVMAHQGLRRLLLYFMVVNIGVSVFAASFVPYVLSFLPPSALAGSMSLQGAGAFLAGSLMSKWRKWSKPEETIVIGALCYGAAMVLWGLSRHWSAVLLVAFAFGALETLVMASSQTVWQSEVPKPIQGKVFAVRTVLSFGLSPLSVLVSVPLSMVVFTPALQSVPLLQRLWGAPPSGSLGLMVSTLGVGVVAWGAWLVARGGLRVAESRPASVAEFRAGSG